MIRLELMKLYLVRHGETTYNAAHKFQPHDSELSDLGIKQAEFLAERFKNISIDTFISSSFYRARQTSEIINKNLNLEIMFTDLLREMTRPSEFVDKLRDDPALSPIKALIRENAYDKNWHYSDEENFEDLKTRATAAMEFIEKSNGEGILALNHGEFTRIIVSTLMLGENMSYDEYSKFQKFFRTINTGITILEKSNNKWKLLTWNDHSHLG